MLSLKRPVWVALMTACLAAGQPALTTIQDTLYKADGTRFTGTVYINYSSFQAESASTIATYNLTINVVNGAFRVRLVPTTTASAGAHYNIRYNSRGINDFTEQWAVPPSTVSLRIRDVRTNQGTVVGPQSVVSPVQLPDVIGLQNELALRPPKGVGFAIGRTAVINAAGQLDGAAGNLGDCVRVDGTAGACGGSFPSYADGVIPSGAVNGTNAAFSMASVPSPAASLSLYRNGLLQRAGTDFLLSGATATFFSSSIPQAGDILQASYRYGPQTSNSLFAPVEVLCAGAGSSASTTISTRVGSCVIPATTLQTGDRIAIEFGFAHTGTASGFTTQVLFGTSTVLLSRTISASESLLTGRASVGTFSGAQVWDVQSLGTISAAALATGTSTEDITQQLVVDFRGMLSDASPDTISLRNFTVLRYPSQ